MSQVIASDNRLAAADLLKVAAIFAVVFIHGSSIIPFSPSSIDFSHDAIGLAANGFRFCVPVFIFMWAYFMEKSVIKRGTGTILSRFYKLLIPYAFWSLVYSFVNADIQHISILKLFLKYWTGYGWSGQYYFIILFQFFALFPLVRWISIKLLNFIPAVYVISILFFTFVAYSGWSQVKLIVQINDRVFIYWLPYVVLGIIHAHRNIFKLSLPAVLSILSVTLIPLEVYFFHPKTLSPYALPTVFITSMLLVSLMGSALKYQDMPARTGRLVNRIANYTLGIFCLNPLVITAWKYIFHPVTLQFPGSSVICPILSTTLVCSICVLVIILFKKIKLGVLVST